jgi:hypothetical protein
VDLHVHSNEKAVGGGCGGHAAMFTDKPNVEITRFFSQFLNGFWVVASKKNANDYSGQPERYSDMH